MVEGQDGEGQEGVDGAGEQEWEDDCLIVGSVDWSLGICLGNSLL